MHSFVLTVGERRLALELNLLFTLTANSGYWLNLSSISFEIGGTNNSTAARTSFVEHRTGAEAVPFSTSLCLTPGPVTTGQWAMAASSSTTYGQVYTADLSAAIYQNLPSITFRLYPFASASVTNAFVRFDNISVQGQVAIIPEPSSWLLMLVSLLALVFVCRVRCFAKAEPRKL